MFLTARGSEADRVLGLELGAVDYMVKPFSIRELSARIKGHLRAPQTVSAPVLCAGTLELDHQRHRVTLDGLEVQLTATEFRLLDYFMARPGLVLSRGQLLEGVWRNATALTERVIDVYVLRLRNKIEPEKSDHQFIFSIRGYGYRFDEPPVLWPVSLQLKPAGPEVDCGDQPPQQRETQESVNPHTESFADRG